MQDLHINVFFQERRGCGTKSISICQQNFADETATNQASSNTTTQP